MPGDACCSQDTQSHGMCAHCVACLGNRCPAVPQRRDLAFDVLSDKTKENRKEEEAVQEHNIEHDCRARSCLAVDAAWCAEQSAVSLVDGLQRTSSYGLVCSVRAPRLSVLD